MKRISRIKREGLIIFLCLVQSIIFAQYQIYVLDNETKQAIEYAEVYFPDLKTTTITNTDGSFLIDTKSSSVLIQISCTGYKTFLGTVSLEKNLKLYLNPSLHNLQEVVISANSSKLQGENVANVGKLNLKNNTEIQGTSLSQKLSAIAGIDNFSTGTGIGKPVIRGLSGNRIAVFSQGIRIENQQWGDEHGLGLDENGYEQIEIIKGPASLLYGSDALGGVLYFADERYAKENSIEADIRSQYNTNTNGWRNTGAFKLSKNQFHWNIFGGYTTNKDYKGGDNVLVENSCFRTGDLKTTFGYTGKKFTTSLKYNFLNEQYGLTEAEETEDTAEISYTSKRKPDFPYQDLTTHLVSSENTFFFENTSKLKVDIGYVFNNRKEYEEETEDGSAMLDMNLGTASYNIKWYSPLWKEHWALIVGSQGLYQTNTNHGEELLIPDATTFDAGIFAMSDYYYTKNSYWQIGLRFDERYIKSKEHGTEGEEGYFSEFSRQYPAFNFSTGIYQQLPEQFSLRVNLSSGYRAPNMFELLSDGVHEGTNRYEIGNNNLKTENSYQADISIGYNSEHVEVFLNPYFNYINHYIYLQPTNETIDDIFVYRYVQNDAFLYGGEAGFHFHPHPWDWLHVEGTYNCAFGQNTKFNYLPLMPSQKINAIIRASFSWKKVLHKFSVYIQEQYSFTQNQIAEYEELTKDYNLINAGVSFDFKAGKQHILFSVAVNNIFNETYYDHLSRYKQDGIYNMGRNLNVQLGLPFQFFFKQ
ncbi:MAG: TonB-dependent receptor [Bacteroidales bacterium]|jgi:iron complex outermembrane receptor protein|nr:TonB-dependent receptor [Bacteroidales bacterium]